MKLLALRVSPNTVKELMRPLRLVTFPHFHTTSPSEVLSKVAEETLSSDTPPSLVLSAVEWLEDIGGVTSLVRGGFPREGPNPIIQEVKFCK